MTTYSYSYYLGKIDAPIIADFTLTGSFTNISISTRLVNIEYLKQDFNNSIDWIGDKHEYILLKFDIENKDETQADLEAQQLAEKFLNLLNFVGEYGNAAIIATTRASTLGKKTGFSGNVGLYNAEAKQYNYLKSLFEGFDQFYNNQSKQGQRIFDNILSLFARVNIGQFDQSAFIDMIIIFEMIFNKNDQPISSTIAYRFACFLGETSEEKQTLFHLFKKCYSLRSKIVHGIKVFSNTPEIETGEKLENKVLVPKDIFNNWGQARYDRNKMINIREIMIANIRATIFKIFENDHKLDKPDDFDKYIFN